MKARVRPAFYEDIERGKLWLHEHAGSDVAQRWQDAVWETLLFLATQPGVGRLRRDLKSEGIRSWRVEGFRRWLVFYSALNDAIVFYRVVGGQMDLRKLALS
jgi:toxin ParE1/3/4